MNRLFSRSMMALTVLMVSQPLVRADALKVTPTLAGFKQIGPRLVEFVFSVDVQDKVPDGYAQFVHVTSPGADRPVFQTGTGIETKPETWAVGKAQTGSLVVLPLANDLADGEYEFKFGLYHTVKGDRLELKGNNDGQRRYILGKMSVAEAGKKVTMAGVPAVTPAMEGRIKVTPGATDFSQAGPRAFAFKLVYDVQEKLPAGQEAFVHVTYANPTPGKDTVVGAWSGIRTSPETWPVGQKTTGELVTVTLPETVPDGIYTVRTGLYAAKGDNSRVKMTGNDDGGRRFIVVTFQVSENGKKIALVDGK